MNVQLSEKEVSAIVLLVGNMKIGKIRDDNAFSGLLKIRQALVKEEKKSSMFDDTTSIYSTPNSEFADYLLMLADDMETSGMQATADDYRECARRLKR